MSTSDAGQQPQTTGPGAKPEYINPDTETPQYINPDTETPAYINPDIEKPQYINPDDESDDSNS